jgi:hypothetical protein
LFSSKILDLSHILLLPQVFKLLLSFFYKLLLLLYFLVVFFVIFLLSYSSIVLNNALCVSQNTLLKNLSMIFLLDQAIFKWALLLLIFLLLSKHMQFMSLCLFFVEASYTDKIIMRMWSNSWCWFRLFLIIILSRCLDGIFIEPRFLYFSLFSYLKLW